MSPAFHSFPDRLDFDPVSGDNGPNLFGHVWNTATYVVNHPEFGWLAFGGNRRVESDVVKVKPLDSARTRVYLAPLGVWLTLDAGQFETVEMNCKNGSVRMGLAPASRFTPTARLRIGQPAIIKGIKTYRPGKSLQSQRGAFLVPLSGGTTWVALGQEP